MKASPGLAADLPVEVPEVRLVRWTGALDYRCMRPREMEPSPFYRSGEKRPMMNDTSTILDISQSPASVIILQSSGYAILSTMLRVTVDFSVAISAHASPS